MSVNECGSLWFAGELVQLTIQNYELRHDERQAHGGMSTGLASNPQVMAQQRSFTNGGGGAAQKFLWQEMVEGASLRGP